ncbi:MAG: phospholipase D-like domain-containing protein [Acidobacteriota bacterium]
MDDTNGSRSAPPPATPDRGWRHAPLFDRLSARCALPIASATEMEIVHCGDEHFRRVTDAIGAARREIAIEMYQVKPDEIGRRVARALLDAAARGVRVRLLADAWGSKRFAGEMRRLRRGGVDARWYSPWRPWNSPMRRTHRKLVVVDRALATIGGMNFAREFSQACCGAEAWRDVSAWFSGPVVEHFALQFEAAWGDAPDAPSLASTAEGIRCAVVGGSDGRQGFADAYRALVDGARREVLIANPYFIPDPDFRGRLAAAARRGVRVTVVVPRRCDIEPFKHAARRLYGGLLRAGVTIIERQDRMVHAKVAVVDRELAAIGSANINRRSFYWNGETLLLTDHAPVVREISAFILEEGAAAGEELTISNWAAHPDRRPLSELLSTPVYVLF